MQDQFPEVPGYTKTVTLNESYHAVVTYVENEYSPTPTTPDEVMVRSIREVLNGTVWGVGSVREQFRGYAGREFTDSPPVCKACPRCNGTGDEPLTEAGSDPCMNCNDCAGTGVLDALTLPKSYLYTPPGPDERFEQSPGNPAVGTYYCTKCGAAKYGFNDGTRGGSASTWGGGTHTCTPTLPVPNPNLDALTRFADARSDFEELRLAYQRGDANPVAANQWVEFNFDRLQTKYGPLSVHDRIEVCRRWGVPYTPTLPKNDAGPDGSGPHIVEVKT